ncbi:hypothetical protein [Nonomuraea sp. NPDC023979]|uniref:hypothetical protein n=1 Tax=Nonomuraea sp. NPDC023979 TaxID=3154796 RepID=UPI0033E90526
MAPRVSVLVKPVEGGHQAVCQTHGCAEGPASGVWKSDVHTVKAGAEDDARTHRQWHRRQQAVPVEKITLLWVGDHGLATTERSVTPEQADRIAGELLDARTSDGVELLVVRARRGKLSLVDVVVPLQVAARTMADLAEVQ